MKNKIKWVWKLNTDTYIEIITLALHHGKKTGDSMRDEFKEILQSQRDLHKLHGVTDKVIEEMINNMDKETLKMPDLDKKS